MRYRTGYYDVKAPDLLKGKPEGKALEARVASPQAGEIPVSLSAPYFYVEPGVARVNLALSVPGSAIDFEKAEGDFPFRRECAGNRLPRERLRRRAVQRHGETGLRKERGQGFRQGLLRLPEYLQHCARDRIR